MPIAATCSHCGKSYKVGDTLAGKNVKCAACGKGFAVPALAAGSPPPMVPPPVVAAPVPVSQCPSCRQVMDLNAILCVNCGYNRKTNQLTRIQVERDPPPASRPVSAPRTYGGGGRSGMANLLIGGVICAVGTAVTVGTYMHASESGGRYTVAYGAIVFGGIQFLKGLFSVMSGD